MKRVVSAIESGRCVLGVSASLLRDADVMLELSRREALPTVALSGPATAPVQPVSEASLVRAVAQPGGVIVLVDPDTADTAGIQEIGTIVKRARHTPTVIVVSHAFNPFFFAQVMPGIAVSHIKARGKSFVRELPEPPAVQDVPAPERAKAKAAGGPEAPHLQFLDREDELATLRGMLGEGGPIVVSGSQGSGRAWLTEQALADAGLARHPDFVIGWGTGADALFARIAEIAKQGGDDTLATLLGKPHTPYEAIAAAISSLQGASGTDGQVMVVRELNHAMGRDGDFFRKGRLEALLEALLTNTYPLRIVFLAEQQPVFYREGAAATLRRLSLGGIKGRFLYEIFQGYKAPEFPREKMGPISEKVKGHPLAARTYAIAVRDRKAGLELLDDPKFLALESFDDVTALKKQIRKQVDKVKGAEREALARLAHLRMPISGALVSELGIGRKGRIQLLSAGLLDTLQSGDDKRYLVHPMVRLSLSLREVSDFDTLGRLGQIYARLSRDAESVEKLAHAQEANRCLAGARRFRDMLPVPYPDQDALVESVIGLVRGRKPNFQLARQRIGHLLSTDPSNSDAWLLKIEMLQRSNAKNDEIAQTIDEAIEHAPVPEIYHQAVSWYLQRRARPKAIAVLEDGIARLPDESRLKTRLAVLLLRVGRRPEAIAHLDAAMAQDPMLPDAYGIKGMARREEGLDALDDAEALLREAVRLAPEDPVQGSRLADLLVAKARVDLPNADALRAEAHEILDRVVRGERRAPEAQILLARLIREQQGDLDRSAWLLKQVRKITDRHHERSARLGLEYALLDLARGELEKAESTIRGLADKDPSNHEVFAALAQILEARELLIPAHAEYMRAKERSGPNTIERVVYDRELGRLQELIEAQAAGLAAAPQAQPAAPAAEEQRVIRRPKAQEPEAAPSEGAEAEGAEAAPSDEAEATDPASTEAGAESPEDDADPKAQPEV